MPNQSDDDIRQTDASKSSQSANNRVLVVDDDQITLKLVSNMLSAMGFHVECANGGIPAMRRIIRSMFHVVVTDLQMPDMDGFVLSDWLKKKVPDTRVVIMTGCSPIEVTQYRNADIVDYWIFKPFGLGHLREIMSEIGQTDPPVVPIDPPLCHRCTEKAMESLDYTNIKKDRPMLLISERTKLQF